MQQAEHQQPAQTAPVGRLRGRPTAQLALQGTCLQGKAGAKQEGEDGIELELRQRRHAENDELVQHGRLRGQGAITQGKRAPGKAPDIHQQDAKHGDAAQHVELQQPGRFGAHGIQGRARVGYSLTCRLKPEASERSCARPPNGKVTRRRMWPNSRPVSTGTGKRWRT